MPANYVLLQRIELNASAASVTFSNIPQSGYTDLKIVSSARIGSAVTTVFLAQFNGDTTGANYAANRYLEGNGTSASSSTNTPSVAGVWAGNVTLSTDTASTFANSELYIPNAFTSGIKKSTSVDAVSENNATTTYADLSAGLWNGTASINQITLTLTGSASFVQYSTFSLYGLAAVGTTPAIAPKATGGNITTDGTYWIHTFLASDTFTPATNLTCDYLVVAGGAGGGYLSGGGGAGGFRTATSQTLTNATSYTVTVGAGGAGTTSAGAGSNGNASVFSTISSSGGGNGGYYTGSSNFASSGGSGGGASLAQSNNYGAGNSGSYSPVEGYRGGSATASNAYNNGAGGGGGSSAVGSDGNTSNGGAGGAGTSNSYSGSAVTYAIGGGGVFNSNNAGGGTANGAAGTTSSHAQTGDSGNANTGNGGGASGNGAAYVAAGNGGSGIVIIRYAMA